MERLGGPGAGLAIALENIFPPIPSELILPLAGFAASRGAFTVYSAIAWTTLGSVVGALVLYTLGRRLGRDRMRQMAGRVPLVEVDDVDRTERWFDRHGTKAVFFGRMVPLFRSLISIPAGTQQMPYGWFVILTAAGSLVWNSVLILAGYFLGEQWEVAQRYTNLVQNALWAALAIGVAWFVVARVRRRQAR